MTIENSNRINILSLLAGPLEQRLRRRLSRQNIFRYHKFELPTPSLLPEQMIDKSFWSSLPLGQNDLVLIPITGDDLQSLNDLLAPNINSGDLAVGIWTEISPAIIAVLVEDSLHNAVWAARLDFDAILAEPFMDEQLPQIFQQAIDRRQRRFNIARRYRKMRHLVRTVNRNRRYLRNKVDLLCRDLIHSNTDLTATLLELLRVHNFQSDLMGEFDLRYMLHKALRHIKEQVPDSSAMIFLNTSNNIEAHIYGPWYDDQRDLAEVEELLKETIIDKVVTSGRPVSVPDAGARRELAPKHRNMMTGLSLMGLPVILDNEILGALAIYRDWTKPLADQETATVQPYLPPLARAIAAIQKIQPLIIK